MRAVLVVVAIVLAGCAGAPEERVGPDPSQALYSGAGQALYQLGDEAEGTPDAQVLIGQCSRNQNVRAYSINVTGLDSGLTPSSVQLSAPAGVPNATRFQITAFTPGSNGLSLARHWWGGPEADLRGLGPSMAPWAPLMPTEFTAPVGADGWLRLAIACEGGEHVNYVLGGWADPEKPPKQPHYVNGTVADGFDNLVGIGYGTISLYFPPTVPPSSGSVIWSHAGNVYTDYTDAGVPGVRSGDTLIEMVMGPGWSKIECAHFGLADHGYAHYAADMHGDVRQFEIPVADGIATLGLAQQLLFGRLHVEHIAEGDAPATVSWRLEHLASSEEFWDTSCEGVHLGATLTDLFGIRAAGAYEPPRTFISGP